ncbi:MAG: ATP-binding cassette domain-containing protein, partial [Verrucomicrobiota bacterium]
QQVYLSGYLTVEETMFHQAGIRDIDDPQSKIDDLLKHFQLALDRTKRVSELSGGTKKRLSIAIEMMKPPELMLLDEPTTALDEENVRRVYEILRAMSDRHVTVVLITHQNREFQFLDHLIVLPEAGRIGYTGPPGDYAP